MITRIARGIVAGAGALAVAGAVLVAAPAASASGTLTLSPTTGDGATPLSVTTSGGCASPNATHFLVKLSGGALTESVNFAGVQPLAAIPAIGTQTTPMAVPLPSTFEMAQEDYGRDKDDTSLVFPSGVYTMTFVCRSALDPAPIAEFSVKVTVTQIPGGLTFKEGEPIPTQVAWGTVPATVNSGSATTLEATVKDQGGAALSGAKVNLEITGSATIGTTGLKTGSATTDAAGKISVVVTAGTSGTFTVKATSDTNAAATATTSAVTIKQAVITNVTKPAISGQAKAGQTLRVSNGKWSVTPTSHTYAWKIGSREVGTASTYTVKNADKGKTIKVTVTAKRAGYVDGKVTVQVAIAR